ncbi:hypothetical protein [Kosakonia cowanii]|uniref:hypothetical protein n=1 Tax=Kosakonia cowanii TaxID=208223 RepID=UPI0021E8C8EF|nr:hypothetical protein [Kosakonia cowanii]
MTNNDELALKSEERIKAIANGAQMLMGESRQLAAAALYWKEQARIATDAFQQSGIMQVKAEDKIEVLLAERDADKNRIAEFQRQEHYRTRQAVIDGLAACGECWDDIKEYMERWDAEAERIKLKAEE